MIKKIFFFNICLFFIFLDRTYANFENSIIVKIDNQIITNFEIKNKILTDLILSDREITQDNINSLKKKSLESLIQLKLKMIELSKYDVKISNTQLEQLLNSISSNDINSLKKKFINSGLDYNLFIEELKTGLMWQQFIFSKYSKKINIDPLQVENELKNLIKNNKNLEEYNLSEIEIAINDKKELETKIKNIEQQIDATGFEQTAFNISDSPTSTNQGNIGWVNSKSLSKDIFEILNKMSIGQVSKPIVKKNNVLFLKINDKRIKELDKESISKLKNDIINQKKNELFNLYSKSHISKIKSSSLIEYK